MPDLITGGQLLLGGAGLLQNSKSARAAVNFAFGQAHLTANNPFGRFA